MKRVLVIGEHSYIGRSFQNYMKEVEPEIEIALTGAKNGEWKNTDLSGYDAILHVAAIVHRKEMPDMEQMYHEVNTLFPVELAQKAKEEGVKQFLFLSTMAVYGDVSSPIDFNATTAPVSMYGKSKLAAEEGLKKLAEESFQVVVFRPPMVYGAGCPGNYKRLAKLAYKLPVFPRIKNQRSMIYIENLCECIRQELQETKGEYHLVCPQNKEYVNTTELVREIRKTQGKKTVIVPFPQFLIKLGGSLCTTVEKVFGNCYYARAGSENSYQVADFKESVRRTEIR